MNITAQTTFKSIYKASVAQETPQLSYIKELAHGTKILSNEAECNRYLALYGGHHYHKLYAAYDSTKFKNMEGQTIEIIDWGCGQALATCVLFDYLLEKSILNIDMSSITLIEPSIVALNCGRNFIRQIFPNYPSIDSLLRMINKSIDDLTPTDLASDPDSIKVHLFSNIIDVEGFDLKQLYQLMVNSFHGLNHVICTSPYNYRRQRLEDFHSLFSQSHEVIWSSNSSEPTHGELFVVITGKYEEQKISRYERQFTVNLV